MADRNEIARLAAATSILRPDWPTRSLETFLARHSHRPFHDLAVAMVWIATDAETRTPARLDEPGPWWQACQPVVPIVTPQAPVHDRAVCLGCGNRAHAHDARPSSQGFTAAKAAIREHLETNPEGAGA